MSKIKANVQYTSHGSDKPAVGDAMIFDGREFVPADVFRADKAAQISNLTNKTTPADADNMLIEDSAASHTKKRLTWANVKATLKSYFDTMYKFWYPHDTYNNTITTSEDKIVLLGDPGTLNSYSSASKLRIHQSGIQAGSVVNISSENSITTGMVNITTGGNNTYLATALALSKTFDDLPNEIGSGLNIRFRMVKGSSEVHLGTIAVSYKGPKEGTSFVKSEILFSTTNAHHVIDEHGDLVLGDFDSNDYNNNIILKDAAAYYIGDKDENGSWRIIRSGNNLLHQRRESGTWVTKQTISA